MTSKLREHRSVDEASPATLVIGGGQAGLAVSYHLSQANHPHMVFERACIGSSWMTKRWRSFTLVTPNWMNRLPGYPYQGVEPDGFLPRREVVSYLEAYASSFGAPIKTGTDVKRLGWAPGGSGYRVETDDAVYDAGNVVVATGYFHQPRIPAFASRVPSSVDQVHSSEYRDPDTLRMGAVLVVGSGQSGCQIAEELHEHGREVYLCVGSAPREPRRYRGRDINFWFAQMGGFSRSFEDPADPIERYRANPHCSGAKGGHAINLWKLAASGITLLGRAIDVCNGSLVLAADLEGNLAKADEGSWNLMAAVDDHIAASGAEAPLPDGDNTDDGAPEERPRIDQILRLDLERRGIATIIWATGHTCDFDWIDLPITDARGYPVQRRGISNFAGLYFCGLHWMHSLSSGLFFGIGDDAQHVTRHLLARNAMRASPAA